MKVLAISQYPPVEGIPTADGPINYALSKYARNEGAEFVWVYAREPDDRLNWKNELEEMGAQAFKARINFKTLVFSLRHAIAVLPRVMDPRRVMLAAKEGGLIIFSTRTVAKRFKPDLIFLASPYAALVSPKFSAVPTVYNSMDSLTFSVDNGLYGRRSGLRAKVQRWLIHKFDRYACAGRDLVLFVSKRDAESSKYAGRTEYVVNGADIERFVPSNLEEKAEIPTLVFQGSCHYPPNRRAIELIKDEIAPLVWAKEPSAIFRFVGAGGALLAGDDPRLQFVGYVSDLGEELRRAWVGLAPIEDGSGVKNKVLDAASSGLPVVGFREAFNGIEGLPGGTLVSDSTEFANSVIELIQNVDKPYALGQSARMFAEELSWQKQVGRYVALLRSVI